MATPTPTKPEKKHKKRVRDDETEDGARKHKRSKSEAVREAAKNEQGLKKSPKSKSKYLTPEKVVDSDSEPELDEPPRQVRTQDQEGDESAPQDTETKKHKKEKKEKKEKKKKEKKQREIEQEKAHSTREEYETEKQKSKSKEKSKEKSNDKSKKKARDQSPEPTSTVPGGQGTLAKGSKSTMTTATTQATSSNEPRIPFVTQTISLYIPFFPLGFSRLPSELAAEILDPMVGAFSSALHGILLAYRKAYLSEKPVRASRKAQPVQDEPLMLSTIDECAAGFAWVTAEMDLFCPSRGAAMEGKLALQSEGHIGLVCWGKFNASIEASRLPPGWTWVDTSHETTNGNGDSAMDVDGDLDMDKEPEKEDALDGEGLEQLHSVGYWVDASGMRVTGTLSFRIKDFQLFAGDHQYLSIEGTMLEPAAERELAAKEREAERARRAKQNPNGLLRPMMKRVPDFSMTTIGDDDGEEDLAIAAFQTTTSLTDA